ncbi:peroxiredoxin [Burkholderia singularis]|uniref:Peroxiredoxin n=1 Tax=Burkholderia singularis TaxID=1503053 RepID=A0A103E5L6_9BURK|nr:MULTISPECIES: OsmC family protein [Burkholderia]AOK31362.1 peroxiredoxin [Burkholderia sp. Bp7605]KVE28802.1 peroxiredoxin [Burkholderia singularis]
MSFFHATAEMAPDAANYVVDLQAGSHRLQGDEHTREGGNDAGPAPYEFVLSGLVACTVATLRMYMQRKSWPDARLSARAELHVERDGTQYVRRTITVDGPLDDAQRQRLLEISEKTPVTLFIKRGTRIDTALK